MLKKNVSFRVFSVLLTVTIALLLLESGLRVYKWILTGKNIKQLDSSVQDKRIILSLGESTTYGIYQKPEETYSALLEEELNRDLGQRKYKVLNHGYPAAISDDIVALFDELMGVYQPVAVIACLGYNDFDANLNYRQRGKTRPISHPFQLKKSRYNPLGEQILLIQIIKYFWFELKDREDWRVVPDRMTDPHLQIKQEALGATIPSWWFNRFKSIRDNLKRNILHMREVCRRRRIPFVLVGYLQTMQNAANKDLREWSEEYDITFVENAPAKRAVGKRSAKKNTWLEYVRGGSDFFHPNNQGYIYISRNILQTLKNLGL